MVDRRKVTLACVLAWLLPGAGHFYLGKKTKGSIFLGIVVVTFVSGLVLHGRVYVASREEPLSYLATFANVALGPLDLIGRQATYARIVYALPSESDPAMYQDVLARKRARILAVTHEYGTTFLLTAGLMNILLILDAFDIGIGRKR